MVQFYALAGLPLAHGLVNVVPVAQLHGELTDAIGVEGRRHKCLVELSQDLVDVRWRQ